MPESAGRLRMEGFLPENPKGILKDSLRILYVGIPESAGRLRDIGKSAESAGRLRPFWRLLEDFKKTLDCWKTTKNANLSKS